MRDFIVFFIMSGIVFAIGFYVGYHKGWRDLWFSGISWREAYEQSILKGVKK